MQFEFSYTTGRYHPIPRHEQVGRVTIDNLGARSLVCDGGQCVTVSSRGIAHIIAHDLDRGRTTVAAVAAVLSR